MSRRASISTQSPPTTSICRSYSNCKPPSIIALPSPTSVVTSSYSSISSLSSSSTPKSHTNSITRSLWSSQISGFSSYTSMSSLPSSLTARLDAKYESIPSALVALERAFKALEWSSVKSELISINQAVCESPTPEKSSRIFVQFLGLDIFTSILTFDFLSSKLCAKPTTDSSVSLYHSIMNESLTVLREVCFVSNYAAETLAKDELLISTLFTLMSNNNIFDNAVGLAEAALALAVGGPIDIATIVPNFTELVSNFSTRQLAFFSRVLALVVFDHKPAASGSNLSKTSVESTDRNQALLLGIPGLLKRFVILLKAQGFPVAEWTETLLQHFPSTQDLLSLLVGLDSPADWTELEELQEIPESPIDNPLFSLKALTLASHQVEIMFVISNLLAGKRKSEVQDTLAKLGMIPILETTYTTLNWGESDSDSTSALRVQFLRLIHNFCDRDDDNKVNKSLLLSSTEMEQVFGGDESEYECDLRCQGQTGLLSQLIQQLINEPLESSYRFWLSSCIESYLRGSTPEEQLWIAKSGLLDHLLGILTSSKSHSSAVNQTSFDLLGELIKFSPEIFSLVNEHLVDEAAFKCLLSSISVSLVDSNVFLRSLLLSLEHFKGQAIDYDFENCKFNEFLAFNGFKVLRDLCTAVSVSEISQENICSINTALVFFIFGSRRDQLDQYLSVISDDELTIRNLQELLVFWQSYYQFNHDSLSLEFSSRIAFSEWKATVASISERLSSK